MIRSAFVAVSARPRHRVPAEIERLLADPRPAALSFHAGSHVLWRSADSELLVGCWAEAGTTADATIPRWAAHPASFAAATGHVRVRGGGWSDASWAEAAVTLDPLGPDNGSAALDGLFTAFSARADGHAVAVSDELGATYLFWAEHPDVHVVGSNAALVAQVRSPGVRPRRDAFAATGLAHTRARVGPRTGFVGVEVLPPGRRVVIAPGKGARVVAQPAPWMPGPELRSLSDTELIDHAEAHLVEAAVAAAAYPAELRLVDLTGGKDSRLVLAGILLAGLTDRFRFRTDGTSGVSDVVVATELAAEFGLDHESGMRSGEYLAPYAERVRSFVEATSGMNGPWAMKAKPADLPDWIRLNGLFGEPLRSYVQRPLAGPADVAAFFNRRLGTLGLLRPESAAQWRAIVEADVEHDRTPEATPHDLLDAFQLRNRVLTGLGPREEQGGIPRLMLIGQTALVQVAFALGVDGRRTARLHRELFARASPALAAHRFAESVVPSRVAAPAAPPAAVAVRPPLEQQGQKDENWAMVRRRATGGGDRRALLGEVFADTESEAWTHLDRPVVLDALARFGELNPQQHQELAAAAGALIWLAG